MQDFRITQIRRDAHFDMRSSHIHQAYEIYYLLSGSRRMFYNDSIYILDRGDLAFIPPNTIHRTLHTNDRTHERIVVTFGPEAMPGLTPAAQTPEFGRLFAADPVLHLAGANRDYVEERLSRLLSEYEQPDEFSALSIRSVLQELLVFLIRYKRYKNEERVQEINTADRLMQKAARYIRGHYMDNVSLESVAAFVGLSPCYFSKKFKSATGFGYREYLLTVRVREACAMLLETDKSITEIALDCGFSDSNYFGDVFKREKGVSPLKYRKSNRFAQVER